MRPAQYQRNHHCLRQMRQKYDSYKLMLSQLSRKYECTVVLRLD